MIGTTSSEAERKKKERSKLNRQKLISSDIEGEGGQMSAVCPKMSENRPPEYRDKSLDIRDKNLENREGDCAPTPLGRYSNVILSDNELANLQAELPTKWQHYIDRLSEYMASTGKKYQSHLATIRRWAADDGKQSGILAALNEYADIQETGEAAWELARLAQSGREGDGTSMLTLRERLTALTTEQEQLLDKVLEDMDNPDLNAQLKVLAEEKQGLLEQVEALRQREQQEAGQQSRMEEMRERLRAYNRGFTEYDDTVTRQMIEKITVLNSETIHIRFRDVDVELDETL